MITERARGKRTRQKKPLLLLTRIFGGPMHARLLFFRAKNELMESPHLPKMAGSIEHFS
jgi:hypothetical protein